MSTPLEDLLDEEARRRVETVPDVHLARDAPPRQEFAKLGEGSNDLVAVHTSRSDAFERAGRDEDAATAKSSGRLRDRKRPEPRNVAHEPERVEEAIRIDGPRRPIELLGGGQMLRQRRQIGIVPSVAGRWRLLRDGVRPQVGRAQPELVDELSHGRKKVVTGTDALRHSGKRLREGRCGRRMTSKPVPKRRDRAGRTLSPDELEETTFHTIDATCTSGHSMENTA